MDLEPEEFKEFLRRLISRIETLTFSAFTIHYDSNQDKIFIRFFSRYKKMIGGYDQVLSIQLRMNRVERIELEVRTSKEGLWGNYRVWNYRDVTFMSRELYLSYLSLYKFKQKIKQLFFIFQVVEYRRIVNF